MPSFCASEITIVFAVNYFTKYLKPELQCQIVVHSFIAARDEKAGSDVCAELNNELGSTNIQFHQLDITSKESIHKLQDHVHDKFGGLDVLINNSAVLLKVQLVCTKTMRCWHNNRGKPRTFLSHCSLK